MPFIGDVHLIANDAVAEEILNSADDWHAQQKPLCPRTHGTFGMPRGPVLLSDASKNEEPFSIRETGGA